MSARAFGWILLLLFAGLQYRLWISEDGVGEVRRLQAAVAAQAEENAGLRARNERLAAEVLDLKAGGGSVEMRARRELGMIREGETFYYFAEQAEGRQATGPRP